VAAYSLVLAGGLTLAASILTLLSEPSLRDQLEWLRREWGPSPVPPQVEITVLELVAGFLFVLAAWHAVVAFGTLRLKSWARYNMIVLAALELPGLPFLTAGSVAVLVYLTRRPVVRLFELGRGEVTLPTAEARALERYIRGRPLG
jgi:hypothetical protein